MSFDLKYHTLDRLTRRTLFDHNNIDNLYKQKTYDTDKPWEIRNDDDITLLSFCEEEECIETFRKILDDIHQRHKTVVILSPQKINLELRKR